MATTRVGNGVKTIINAAHRNGICVECGIQMVVKEVPVKCDRLKGGKTVNETRLLRRPVCPDCGGMVGQLIARPISIQPPDPPKCISPRCLFRFVMDSLFVAFLSTYHSRRFAYAEANRPEKKKILERYRTGEPAPKNLWQAIHANIKLTCPICRKYNVDPLLGG